MSRHPSRRAFLRGAAAAAAGGWLMARRPRAAARAWHAPLPIADSPAAQHSKLGRNSLIAVVTQPVSRDVNPRAGSWPYITEILRRAGLFFVERSSQDLPALAAESNPIVLLAGDLQLTADQRRAVAECVKSGGALIGIGGTSGLEEVFGVRAATPMAEGWMKVTAQEHRVTAGLRSSLHVFGGCTVQVATATPLAQLEAGAQGARGSVITEHRFGQGCAILLAPDLIFSVVHIQQGLPVLQDRQPAPDGSAPTNDGVLKAEDGGVLDWVRDRQPLQPDNASAFLEPVSDELREVILRGVFHAARQQGVVLPLLWYWPRGLKAVGHISHDTDGNDPQLAAAMLEVMRGCDVKSTWCTLYPGGYPRDFYRALREHDYEIALHYDAMTGGPQTCWSKDNLLRQHEWLLQEAELSHITSNKNHYTRWENRLDFWRWCEEVGIRVDQTRGPTKKGTIGFPLGGSQPYFPWDDERAEPRPIDVLEINLLTQDLVVVCPREYGRQLLDSAARHHGVAHFLFHPAHIQKPFVADALSELVDDGRGQGLEWWTSAQIYRWEKLRRGVNASCETGEVLTLAAEEPVPAATLLLLASTVEPRTVQVNGQPTPSQRWNLYGFEFDALPMDIHRLEVQI